MKDMSELMGLSICFDRFVHPDFIQDLRMNALVIISCAV